jgi:HSP20 family protein
MNALTRFDRMDDFMPELFRRFARSLPFDAELPPDMRLDVTENDKEYLVTAEVPGARKDDIRVVVDGRSVSISAETRSDTEKRDDKSGRVLLKETTRGSFSRSFLLSQEVDDKTATAKLEDGLLKLRLPKRASSGHRLLAIE